MDDLISRQMAIDAVSEYATIWMSYTDDMSASDIAQEAINSAKDTMIRILKEQPTVQPEQRWIPVKNRLPAVPQCRCLITRDDGRGRATVEEALFSFGRWYGNEWLEDGRNRKFDISTSVIAWAPFPAPYRGGDSE